MKLTAIVTVDHAEVLGLDFARLLESGRAELDAWVVVLRSKNIDARKDCEQVLDAMQLTRVTRLVLTDPCGISRARNEGLKIFLANGVTDDDVVCFPDDDCHYAPGFGDRIRERFFATNTDLAITPYAPEPHLVNRSRWPLHLGEVSPVNLMKVTSSAGIFIRASKVEPTGGFDEQFGVGSPLAAAEDVDFVLRAVRRGLDVRYWGDIAVLHAYKSHVPARQLGNFLLTHRHRDVLPPLSQVRAFARLLLNLQRHSGVRSLASLSKSKLAQMGMSSTTIPLRRSIGGLQIDTAAPTELIDRASAYVVSRGGRARSVVAAHITSLNHAASPAFRSAFNSADITMVDGISLALVSWLTPGPRLKKLATTDFAPAVFALTSSRLGRPVKVGIIGGEEHVVKKAAAELDKSPDVDLIYATHGYWGEFSTPIDELNSREPDILILGLGMPLEAAWLDEHQSAIRVPLIITCGGWLRLLANIERRAPHVLQKIHLEWLWRLLTDPKRTTPRYATGVATVAKAIMAPWQP